MAGAAFSSLTNLASVSLINNQGDVEAILKELGPKDNVKQLTLAITSAGISHKIDKSLGLKGIDITQIGFDQRLVKVIADSTSTSLLQTAVYGSDFEENLKKNLRMQFATVATQDTFSNIIKDLDGDILSDNITHKLAAGLTGCISTKAAGNRCEAGSIGAVVGEMWGDYQVDDSNTLTQAQKDKLINQAKMIAGITAAFAGEDVNVAASVAAEAVENNGLKAVVQTVKIAGKLVKVAVKNSKVTIKDLKGVLRKEGFDIVDDLITLTDGQLTFDDAKAIIDLVVGTNLNNRQEKIDMIVKKRGLNTNPYSFSDLEKIASKFGYESKTIGGVKLFYNKKGNPKYLIRSNTSHSGDVFKGVNDERSAINIASRGSSKAGERLGSYNIHLERVGD
ncbi:DUF637 domain-containing protein [Moraxella catarrhalis]|uniref:DUF637 domain-containing protein n=1 Tax=Moraxella catarrhalis TaxID=480 RepID=UPI0009C1783C|nr:DUF637 domain-containing protein [Moraxella catarrhalis]